MDEGWGGEGANGNAEEGAADGWDCQNGRPDPYARADRALQRAQADVAEQRERLEKVRTRGRLRNDNTLRFVLLSWHAAEPLRLSLGGPLDTQQARLGVALPMVWRVFQHHLPWVRMSPAKHCQRLGVLTCIVQHPACCHWCGLRACRPIWRWRKLR